jgi:hypothetical protein
VAHDAARTGGVHSIKRKSKRRPANKRAGAHVMLRAFSRGPAGHGLRGLPATLSRCRFSSRDTGNHISFAGLRACAEYSRFRFLRSLCGIARAIRRPSMRFRRRLSVSLESAAAVNPSRRASPASVRGGRTPFDPARAKAGGRPGRAKQRARGFFWPVRYLTGNINDCSNGRAIVDLPSHLERASERLAFGEFPRAGANPPSVVPRENARRWRVEVRRRRRPSPHR